MKQKAADQERRRRELESKRLEAEKIAKERRDREAQEQQQRLDAAKRRAQEDEERRLIREMPREHWKNLTRFILYTGLRVSEALSVRPMDRTNEGMQIKGKGR